MYIYVVSQKYSQNHFISEKYNYLSKVSLKIVPFCNYTLLPGPIKLLQTLLGSIMLKPFQLFHRILNVSVA
jgi:hypothetical protein